MSANSDRRLHRRLPISAEAMVTILIPEETFSPNAVRGVAQDISVSGLKVKIYQFSQADYKDLIKGVRFAKIDLTLPYVDEPLVLRAQVVWVDYHDATRSDRAHCLLGMKFHNVDPAVAAKLEYVIDRLSADTVKTEPSGVVKRMRVTGLDKDLDIT